LGEPESVVFTKVRTAQHGEKTIRRGRPKWNYAAFSFPGSGSKLFAALSIGYQRI